jgi:hypothetical protein
MKRINDLDKYSEMHKPLTEKLYRCSIETLRDFLGGVDTATVEDAIILISALENVMLALLERLPIEKYKKIDLITQLKNTTIKILQNGDVNAEG